MMKKNYGETLLESLGGGAINCRSESTSTLSSVCLTYFSALYAGITIDKLILFSSECYAL